MGVEPPDCNKLYIRLPVKIKDEFQIRDLHQNIIEVHLPRQKSRRWCIIDFENKEKLQEAEVALKKVRIDNKSIKIGSYKKGGNKKTEIINRASTKSFFYIMGVTFIGNPFDQETEYDDDDWEMNTLDEWIIPPQEVAFIDEVGRAMILVPEDYSEADDDSDEDYNPEDDNYEFETENSYYGSVYDSNDDEEDIDYVTYPLRDEETAEPDKPSGTDTAHTGENSDTD